MIASQHGHDEMVKWLVLAGARTEEVDKSLKTTAIMFACIGGHHKVVRQLLVAGADGNVRSVELTDFGLLSSFSVSPVFIKRVVSAKHSLRLVQGLSRRSRPIKSSQRKYLRHPHNMRTQGC